MNTFLDLIIGMGENPRDLDKTRTGDSFGLQPIGTGDGQDNVDLNDRWESRSHFEEI